jgi:tetratricopeptide (TPR) repeat protein
MTRLPREWVAMLALSASLLMGGCGRPSSSQVPIAKTVESASTPYWIDATATEPPQLFAAPARLVPLASLMPPTRTEPPSQPVQAQYAQATSPPPSTSTSSNGAAYAPQPAAANVRQESIYAPQLAPQFGPATGPPPQHTAEPVMPQRPGNSAVAEQAGAMKERATQMAQKGTLFAAKNELVQALQLVAQARDVQDRSNTHVAALSAGLTALKEADDFSPEPGRDSAGIRVGEIARGHRTNILHHAGDISPVVAQQHYYSFAQQQLSLAVAGEPAASHVLYTLGKIQMALAGPASQTQSFHGPRAMVFYQAALAVDHRNHQAANELGVLLARYGQLPEARRALLHSITIQPHVEGWHNLAIVHRRLGETELAELAENERRLLASKLPADADKLVNWVDPRTFASSGSQEPGWHAPTSTTAALPSNPTQRR